MAILTPIRDTPFLKNAPDGESIVTALRPWHRRLIVQQTIRWTLRGAALGLFLLCVPLLLSRFFPWATAPYWAIGLALATILFALASALWYRPSLTKTAQYVDKHLALHDRLGTAWELRTEQSVLAQLQRRDALQHIKTHNPAKSLSLRPHRSLMFILTVFTVIAALLTLLPNPMNDIVKQQSAFQNTIAKQIKAIDKTRQDLVHQQTLTPTQQKQLDQILRDLQAKLKQAQNKAEAQQAIAEAQAKIEQLRNPQTTRNAQGSTAASTSLQNSTTPSLSSLGQALASGNSKQRADALKSLGSQVSKLTPEQRSKLAQQIEEAANKASSNPTLSKSLHQLAKATANGTASEVADAANAVSAAAAQDSVDQAQDAAIGQTAQSVQQAANNFASATDGTANPQQTPQGQGQGKGQGQGQGQGKGQGQGGNGTGGSGGANGAGNNKGKNEQVTVPGQITSGTSTRNKENGPNSVVQDGSSVPYSQVIEQYNQAAHDAIDNSTVPPDVKDLVHGYFNTLEGQ